MSEVKSSFQNRRKNGEDISRSKLLVHDPQVDHFNVPYSDDDDDEDNESSEEVSQTPKLVSPILNSSDVYAYKESSVGSYKSDSPSHEPNTPTDTEILQKRPSYTSFSGNNNQDSLYSPSLQYGLSSTIESSLTNNILSIRNQKLNEGILLSLFEEERIILQRLQDLQKIHNQISSKGLSSAKVRIGISNCFKSLNQLYEAISEIYDQESQRKLYIVSQFEGRKHTKQELQHEIELIRDPSKGEGFRLKQLMEEKQTVDEEYKALEKRLKQLKEKKSILRTEIEQSRSVIESRTSSYLEALREIDEEDKNDLHELSEEGNITISKNQIPTNKSSLDTLLSRISLKKNSEVNLQPETALISLKLQLQTLKDNSIAFKRKQDQTDESVVVLENISDSLDGLEKQLAIIVKTQSPDDTTSTKQNIINALKRTYQLLSERKASFSNINDTLSHVLDTEMKTLESSLRVLDIQIKQAQTLPNESQRSSPKRKSAPKLRLNDNILSSSPPSAEVITSTQNISAESTNQSSSIQERLKKNLKFNQNDPKQEKND